MKIDKEKILKKIVNLTASIDPDGSVWGYDTEIYQDYKVLFKKIEEYIYQYNQEAAKGGDGLELGSSTASSKVKEPKPPRKSLKDTMDRETWLKIKKNIRERR